MTAFEAACVEWSEAVSFVLKMFVIKTAFDAACISWPEAVFICSEAVDFQDSI